MDTEKDGRVTEIEVTDRSKVTTSLDSVENSSEVYNNDDTVDDDEEVGGPESNVFRNPVLLKLIAENADFATLKSVRSLNKFCKEIVTSQLFKKSRIVLDKKRLKIQEQLEAIKNLKGINDLKISLKFFSGHGFEEKSKMFNDIIKNLSQTLKDLEFNIWTYGRIMSLIIPSVSIQFPALSTLTIKCLKCLNNEGEKGRRLLKQIYASAPNMTALVLVDLSPEDLSLLLDADGFRNWALAPKLKSLTVTNPLGPEDLLPLIKFPQIWESLDLTLRLFGEDCFENIGRLLEINKDSLVSLKLQQETSFEWFPEGRQTLKLPTTFPKLEKLRLALYDQEVKVISGGRAINYSKTFPALTSLSMDLGCFEDEDEDLTPLPPARLWGSLFPPQVFNGLKHFELSYQDLDKEEGIAEDWPEKMFPKASMDITY